MHGLRSISFLLLRRPFLSLVLVVAIIFVIAALRLVATSQFAGFPSRPGSLTASFFFILDLLLDLLTEFGIRRFPLELGILWEVEVLRAWTTRTDIALGIVVAPSVVALERRCSIIKLELDIIHRTSPR